MKKTLAVLTVIEVDDRNCVFNMLAFEGKTGTQYTLQVNVHQDFKMEPCADLPGITWVRVMNPVEADVPGQSLPLFCVDKCDAQRLLTERPLAIFCWFEQPEDVSFKEFFEKWKRDNYHIYQEKTLVEQT